MTHTIIVVCNVEECSNRCSATKAKKKKEAPRIRTRGHQPSTLGPKTLASQICLRKEKKKTGSFSLIERVILSAGAMLIFSVSFQIDQMPEGIVYIPVVKYKARFKWKGGL